MCQSQLGTPEEREHAHTLNSVTCMSSNTRTHGKMLINRENTQRALKVCVDYKSTCVKAGDDARGFDAFSEGKNQAFLSEGRGKNRYYYTHLDGQ